MNMEYVEACRVQKENDSLVVYKPNGEHDNCYIALKGK